MQLFGIIFVPIIFFINSLAIGKIFQAKKTPASNFLSFNNGSLLLLFLLSVLGIPFLIVPDIINFFSLTILALQGVLLFLYAINWKKFIFSFDVSWFKVIYFFSLLTIGVITWYFLFLKPNSLTDFFNLTTENNEMINSDVSLFLFFLNNFFQLFSFDQSSINVFFLYYLPLFLVLNFSAGLTHSFDFNNKKVISTVSFLVFGLIGFLSMFLIPSFFNNFFVFVIAFLPPILFYLFRDVSTKKQNHYYVYFLFFSLFLVTLNQNFILYSLMLFVFYSANIYFRKIDFNTANSFSLFFFMILALAIFFLRISIIISLLLSLAFVTLYSLYLIYKKNDNFFVTLHKFEVNSQKSGLFFLAFSILVQIIVLIVFLTQGLIVLDLSLFLVNVNDITVQQIFFMIIYSALTILSLFIFFTDLKNVRKKRTSLKVLAIIWIAIFNPIFVIFLNEFVVQINTIITQDLVFSNFEYFFIMLSLTLGYFYFRSSDISIKDLFYDGFKVWFSFYNYSLYQTIGFYGLIVPILFFYFQVASIS